MSKEIDEAIDILHMVRMMRPVQQHRPYREGLRVAITELERLSESMHPYSDQNNQPYLVKYKVDDRIFNPQYDQDAPCRCGHPYHRHFDWADNDIACGCKYCECYTFKLDLTGKDDGNS